MGKLLGRSIANARRHKGLTQDALAKAIGVSRQAVTQWEAGDTDPSTENLLHVSEILNVSVEVLTGGATKIRDVVPIGQTEPVKLVSDRRPEVRSFEDEVVRAFGTPTMNKDYPQDVPVYGVAVGGSEGEFVLNGQIVDYVRRPPGIAKARNVYAIFVIGSSMSPRFEEGEIVYVTPHKPPAIGDYVVVQMVGKTEDDNGVALIKRLERRSGDRVLLSQFNPPAELELDRESIKAMHVVMRWNELLGV